MNIDMSELEKAGTTLDAMNKLCNIEGTRDISSFTNLEHVLGGLVHAQAVCHGLAVHSGWWQDGRGRIDPNDPMVFAAKLALVHSEVSEALEGGRKGLMDTHLPHRRADEVELADTLIRIFDLAGARKMDLAGAVIEKLAYNQQRADHKPEARFAKGGKAI